MEKIVSVSATLNFILRKFCQTSSTSLRSMIVKTFRSEFHPRMEETSKLEVDKSSYIRSKMLKTKSMSGPVRNAAFRESSKHIIQCLRTGEPKISMQKREEHLDTKKVLLFMFSHSQNGHSKVLNDPKTLYDISKRFRKSFESTNWELQWIVMETSTIPNESHMFFILHNISFKILFALFSISKSSQNIFYKLDWFAFPIA